MNNQMFRRVILSCTLAGSVALTTIGCGVVVNPVSPDATLAISDASDAQFCIDEVNRLRASVGRTTLGRSDQIEYFSSEAARVDGEAHEAHKFFRQTNGGGVARAENEIPWWKLSRYGSVKAIIREGLENEWAEGPGGSHWENIT